MAGLTQVERLLAFLRDRGAFGATSWETSVDLRILNSTARVSDLRERGHVVEATREGDHFRYHLREFVQPELGL